VTAAPLATSTDAHEGVPSRGEHGALPPAHQEARLAPSVAGHDGGERADRIAHHGQLCAVAIARRRKRPELCRGRTVRDRWPTVTGGFNPRSSSEVPMKSLVPMLEFVAEHDELSLVECASIIEALAASIRRGRP
jgi:hypothetical protein